MSGGWFLVAWSIVTFAAFLGLLIFLRPYPGTADDLSLWGKYRARRRV